MDIEKKENLKEVIEWVLCIVIAVILALLVRYFVFTPTVVNMQSMYPTLKPGHRLILDRWSIRTKKEIKRGDIITFEMPSNADDDVQDIDLSNPVAKYENEPNNIFTKFSYYVLEINKTSYIKRVIGLEGEEISIRDGKVYVNGEELEEDYLQDDVYTDGRTFNNITVPKGYIFALGDNRQGSKDCRNFGCIPINKTEGKAVFRFWPFNQFGSV